MGKTCFCAIIPDHILHAMERNGTAEHKAAAQRSLATTARLRGQRDILGGMAAMTPPGVKYRTVYNAKNRTRLPGTLLRREGDADTGNNDADLAYDSSGITYDCYKEVFGRNSLDNKGMRLDSTVHYGSKYDNAFFNSAQMVIGDGDGVIFGDFAACLDVVGHEWSHGVTQYTAALEYEGQSGAINESMSDVFGSIVKQWHLKQDVTQADWLIGTGLLLDKKDDMALRSMKAPGTAYDDPTLGKDPQPATMDDYQQMDDDDGGVHINSSIPNHVFYLVAMALGGNSWDKAGPIFYRTLCSKLTPTSNFSALAAATIQAAQEMYGVGGKEDDAVKAAWEAVKVSPTTATQVRKLISG